MNISICPCCGQEIYNTIDPRRLAVAIAATQMERAVLGAVARAFPHSTPTEQIIDLMYAEHSDGGPVTARRVLYVMLHRLRPKLAPYGLTIRGLGGGRSRTNGSIRLERIAA